MTPSSPLEKSFRILRNLLVITAALALTVFLVTAIFVRPLGDDYCISARLVYSNPIEAALYKYLNVSNRFSNQLVASFSDIFGARGVAVLSALTILLWCSGLLLLLREIAKSLNPLAPPARAGVRWDKWNGVLVMELITLFAFYTAPNLYQSIYWRPGVMTYFLPLALFLFLFSSILRTARNHATNSTRRWRGTLALLFVAAFFIGGLSETAGMFHISILGLGWLGAYLWNKAASRRITLMLLATTLIGSIAALVVMFLTPANSLRVDETAAPGPLLVITRAFTYGYQFLTTSALTYSLPLALTFGLAVIFIFLGIKSGHFTRPVLHPRAWLGLLIIPALVYLIIVATFAPSAYGQSFPLERVRFPAHILMIIMLLLEGSLSGWLIAQINFPRWSVMLGAAVFALIAIYPLWMAAHTLPTTFEMAARARGWDRRNSVILQKVAAGEKNIVVGQLPGYANVKELDSSAEHWINRCAAYYYGLETIRAKNGNSPSP